MLLPWGGRGEVVVVVVVMVVGLCWLQPVASQCQQESTCKCTSSEGTIDLNGVNGGQTFSDIADSGGNWDYSYSPCTPFSEGDGECQTVAVCQVSQDGTQTYPAGTVDSAMFGTDGSSTTVTYSQTDNEGTTRTTIVTLQCDQSGAADSLNVQGEDPNNQGTYLMTLVSKQCCPSTSPNPSPGGGGSGGLSVGSILCIVFVAVVFVYIIAGVAVQKGVRKATGREVIPNYTLWAALPGLVKEGTFFVFRGCKGSGTYDKV